MQQNAKKAIILLLTMVCSWWLPVRGEAYVLPGLQILDLMGGSFSKPKSLLVTQKLVLYKDTGAEPVEFMETLRYVFPETFRSDIHAENVERIQVLSRGTTLMIIDGKASDESQSRYDCYKDVILYNPRTTLEEMLKLKGVDVMVSSLGRLDGRPVFVIGAQYPDETVPQVWVSKETFLPLRWIVTGRTGDSREDFLEIRYLDWRQVRKVWYPMQVEFHHNEQRLREIKVIDIEVNPSFPKDLFDINRLRSVYTSKAAEKPAEGGSTERNEVEKTIEEFKKIYK